jgi:hypothetical protein
LRLCRESQKQKEFFEFETGQDHTTAYARQVVSVGAANFLDYPMHAQAFEGLRNLSACFLVPVSDLRESVVAHREGNSISCPASQW